MMRPNKAAAGRPVGGLGGGAACGAAAAVVAATAAVATVEVVFSSSPHIWLSYSDVPLYFILFTLINPDDMYVLCRNMGIQSKVQL